MKIERNGAPIWLSPRRGNGITIIQGTSRIWLAEDEVSDLIKALTEMARG